ncbi:MAG: class I SAM-dependent methyltransferase [Anaerolineae bacterium]
MARWERARDALPDKLDGPVLDLGCAFGYGTAKLAAQHHVIGMDASYAYVAHAHQAHPAIPFLVASAQALPFAGGAFGAVVCLDVIEHVPDDAGAMAEIVRVTPLDAPVIVSTPHQGLLARIDSLNVYQTLRRRFPRLPAPPEIGEGWHRHYSTSGLLALAGDRLRLERQWQTGIGVAEVVHLPLLIFPRGLFQWMRLFNLFEYIYFTLYILEDLIPLPRLGYHLMIRARRTL